jgi:hypothetical protein
VNLGPRSTRRLRRLFLILTGLSLAGLICLVMASVLTRTGDAELLAGMLLATAAAVGGLFVLVDNWANRYDRAFEIGYRMRDLDDQARLSACRPLRLVEEVPSESSR